MNARAKTQRERESPGSWESSLNFVWMKFSGSTQPLEPEPSYEQLSTHIQYFHLLL